MAASGNDGDGEERFSTAEAADALRDLRDNVGPDQLTETFETGGGLMGHEESDLRAAIDVLGTRRAAEILGVDVPDAGVPGEQRTLGGEQVRAVVPEESAEPPPRETATFSTFEGGGSSDFDQETCRRNHEQVDGLLNSARRQNRFQLHEFDQAIDAAQREGCVTEAAVEQLKEIALTVNSDPTVAKIDNLQHQVQRAFNDQFEREATPGNR